MIKEFKILLDKYFEGNTSTEEGKTLQVYFNSEEIAPELENTNRCSSIYKTLKMKHLKQM